MDGAPSLLSLSEMQSKLGIPQTIMQCWNYVGWCRVRTSKATSKAITPHRSVLMLQ